MKKYLLIFIFGILTACGAKATNTASNGSPTASDGAAGSATGTRPKDVVNKSAESNAEPIAVGEPKTIRDFFMLLPEKYFLLEGCEKAKDPDCRKAKLDYLKTFTDVEDTANGYFKGGCDGAQSCIEMTIFKRPDGKYLVAVATEAEMLMDQFFLDYDGGRWTDVAARDVPEYSKKNIYALPRKGTTVEVFAKKIVEKGEDYEVADKGAKLYDLVWKDGKFSIRK